jgi:hypothetical protein
MMLAVRVPLLRVDERTGLFDGEEAGVTLVDGFQEEVILLARVVEVVLAAERLREGLRLRVDRVQLLCQRHPPLDKVAGGGGPVAGRPAVP